jgi:thioredoxin reductase (NADPH)
MPASHEQIPEHDLLIIGGGPAGLSAATYGASERLNTGVVDSQNHLGGQAGTSTFIENYPGFPNGITGPDLMGKMATQAERFGAQTYLEAPIEKIAPSDRGLEVTTHEGNLYIAKNVLLANGVQYNKHPAANLETFLGRGVNYGSPNLANRYKDKQLFVIGGANSAGQAAYALSDCEGCTVHMLIRGRSMEDKMSGYLVDKIATKPNIHVHLDTDLESVDGGRKMEDVTIADRQTNREETLHADELFVMIGASPRTLWLPDAVKRDALGFILTGSNLDRETRGAFEDQYQRPPLSSETAMEGVFAAGDVVSGTQKRVASAVGHGADAVADVHQRRAFNEQKH